MEDDDIADASTDPARRCCAGRCSSNHHRRAARAHVKRLGRQVFARFEVELIELRASRRLFRVDFSENVKITKNTIVNATPEIVATCLVNKLITQAQRASW
jgi:hypothetical protein